MQPASPLRPMQADGPGARLGWGKITLPGQNSRRVGKADRVLTNALPQITMNPEPYKLCADRAANLHPIAAGTALSPL